VSNYINDNEVLDRIIRTRHSVRRHRDEVPERKLIEEVIEAGRLAPYAGLANHGTDDFRHFFVIRNGSEWADQLVDIIKESIRDKLEKYEKSGTENPRMKNMLDAYNKTITNGPPIRNAPWIVIVAERRGFPPREWKSLAHVLQNMWLKAVALGLSFQLFSSVIDSEDNKRLSDMLGLPAGEYSYDACLIGYPQEPQLPSVRNVPRVSVKWLE